MKALFLGIIMLSTSLGAAEIPSVQDMNGKPYFPLGVNYAWQDWGQDFSDQGWPERFKKIETNFDKMQAQGVRTVRWWVYTDFVTAPLWKGEGSKRRCVGMPPGWVANFMKTVHAAEARGIRLYPTFSSFDLGRKGFMEVVSDPAVRQSFIEKAVRPLVKAAGKSPGIFGWDIINEPEWLVRKEDGGDPNGELTHAPITLADLRAYITAMKTEIKAQAKQPVSLGSAGQKWCGLQYDFYSGLGLDFFDVHYYDWMTPWFDITTIPKASLGQAKAGKAEYAEKPMIVGETLSHPETQYTGKDGSKDHTRFLEDLIKMGYAGYLPWAWNEKPEWSLDGALEPHFNRAIQALKLPGLGAAMNTYQNPIIPGFHPDPSICRAGEDYYLVNSTFEFFPGLPIYHSKDLVHWRLIGNALDRPSQNPLKGATDFGGQYAPTIRFWKGLFYLTCTNMSGPGAFIVTAKDPAGPWSEPSWLGFYEMDGSMLFDDDGKAYYTKYAGGEAGEHAGISQAEFDPKTLKVTTPFKEVYNNKAESWNEGPHLYKIKGWYYLMLAEGGTGSLHQEVIGRSKSPWGPFEPCPHNPILTHRDRPQDPIQATGHADLVEAHDGTWWAVFLAVRPKNTNNTSVLGRETFLAPVQWDKDGWPIMNGDHHVSLSMAAPKLKPHPWPALPARDDFKAAVLSPEWIHARNIDPASYSLTENPGYLRLRAVPDSLNNNKEVPALAAQRQRAFRFRARTKMAFDPQQIGVEAGLIVRANDTNHYEVGLEGPVGQRQVFVRNTVKGTTNTVAQAPFEGKELHLQLSGDEGQYQFAWSTDGQDWKVLGASPAADLSKDRAGGFTGAVVGLYATANGKASKAYADFDWFEMEDGQAPAPQALLIRPTPTPQAPQERWHVRAGGGDFVDSRGQIWHPDTAYDGGETAGTSEPIAGAKDAALYQTERWGSDFSYKFPVPAGRYRVTLRFTEAYIKKEGLRVFDMEINGQKVLEGLDILKEAGGFLKAIDKTYEGIQPDAQGRIVLRFIGKVQNAKVCSIEIVPQK